MNQFKQINIKPKMLSAELPQSYKLSLEQIKFYNDNGYLVIKELIDFSTLYACKKRFIDICNGIVDKGNITVMKELSLINSGKYGEDIINKIQDILFDDVFSMYTENPRLLDVVSQIIGDNITAMHSMLINKPPGTSSHPPHQDLHYFPFRPASRIVAAWTAIDNVRKENGCLYVIPRSHTRTLYPHAYPQQLDGAPNKMYHGIENWEKLFSQDQFVELEMSPGDTVFFHPLLVHSSGENKTNGYRKSISCHFAASECEYIDVKGTSQHNIAEEIELTALKRGIPITFVEVWKYRSKLVKGVKCNL